MSDSEIVIVGGPGRDTLLHVLTEPAEKRSPVIFHAAGEALEAEIESVEETGPGAVVALRGRLMSDCFVGAYFAGIYDTAARTGRLSLQGSL